MATDYQGNPITPEQIDGLERFQRNEVPVKLCYSPSTVLTLEIDEAYVNDHEEDAAIYSLLLPSQMHGVLFVPAIGEVISFSKQYAGEMLYKTVLKQFQVTQVAKEIDQNVTCFCLYVTISVVPVDGASDDR